MNKSKISHFVNFVHPEIRILTWPFNIGNMVGSGGFKTKSTPKSAIGSKSPKIAKSRESKKY